MKLQGTGLSKMRKDSSALETRTSVDAWRLQLQSSKLSEASCEQLMDLMGALSTPWGSTLKAEQQSSCGAREGYTLREHNTMWLNRLRAYSPALEVAAPAGKKLPQSKADWAGFFAMVGVLHDAGKPEALRQGDVSRQHELTLELLAHLENTQQMPWSSDEFALARALIDGPSEKKNEHDGDALGAFIYKLSQSDGAPHSAMNVCISAIQRAAKDAGFVGSEQVSDFYRLMMLFYQCDSTSYSLAAGGIHSDPIARSYGLPVTSDASALREVFNVPEKVAREIEALNATPNASKDKVILKQVQELLRPYTANLVDRPQFEMTRNRQRVAFAPHVEPWVKRCGFRNGLLKRDGQLRQCLKLKCKGFDLV